METCQIAALQSELGEEMRKKNPTDQPRRFPVSGVCAKLKLAVSDFALLPSRQAVAGRRGAVQSQVPLIQVFKEAVVVI